jgi:hypothetical protein
MTVCSLPTAPSGSEIYQGLPEGYVVDALPEY